MSLDINREKLLIMGIPFESKKLFNSVLYSLSTNIIEGWQPRKEDVVRLRDEAIKLGIM